MPTLFKATALSIGLLTGVAVTAQAQTVSNPVTPGQSIATYSPEGPRASSHSIPSSNHMLVERTGNYPGPAPGASNGPMPPLFQKPSGWDTDVAMHPYRLGPKPN
jgi:hypothetical protein